MGLFHPHTSQPSDQEPQLQSQLQQAVAPYEAVITAALQWAANWALADCQLARVDDEAHGYQWQLWHTREDNTRFVDMTAMVYFENNHPDKPKMFVVTFKTPSGYNSVFDCPLLREDLYHVLRHALTARVH